MECLQTDYCFEVTNHFFTPKKMCLLCSKPPPLSSVSASSSSVPILRVTTARLAQSPQGPKAFLRLPPLLFPQRLCCSAHCAPNVLNRPMMSLSWLSPRKSLASLSVQLVWQSFTGRISLSFSIGNSAFFSLLFK